MPSFDVVSEVDMHEVANAIDQASREVATRFDFKGTDSRYEHDEARITLHSASDFQLKQMLDILQNKLTKRGVDLACLEIGEATLSGKTARQEVTVRQGLDADLAKRVVKAIKDGRMKVQTSIQGDQVRVTGKKKDDLQQVIAVLRGMDLGLPLQFRNFRD